MFSGRDDVIVQREKGNSSWFGFSLLLNDKLSGKRKELLTTFSDHGIETRPIVAGNFTTNPVMKHLDYAELQEFPIAERIHKDGFFIGNHHLDFRDKIKMVYEVFDDFAKEYK